MQWLHVQIRILDGNVAHVQLVMLEMESIVRNNLYVILIMVVALQWRHVQKVTGVMLLVNVVQDTLVMVLVQTVASKLISHVTLTVPMDIVLFKMENHLASALVAILVNFAIKLKIRVYRIHVLMEAHAYPVRLIMNVNAHPIGPVLIASSLLVNVEVNMLLPMEH